MPTLIVVYQMILFATFVAIGLAEDPEEPGCSYDTDSNFEVYCFEVDARTIGLIVDELFEVIYSLLRLNLCNHEIRRFLILFFFLIKNRQAKNMATRISC